VNEDLSDERSFPNHIARSRLTDGLVAVSFSNICLAGAWFPILYDTDRGYFNKLRVDSPILLALLTNLAALSLLAWIAMRVVRYSQNRLLCFALHAAFFATFLIPLDFCRLYMFKLSGFSVLHGLTRNSGVVLGLAVLAIVFWQHRRIASILAAVVGILSPLALFNLAKIVLLLLGVLHLAQHASVPSPAPLTHHFSGGQRVLWLLFDEFDQRLGLEQSNFILPEFGRFRSESLYATNAFSPADSTRLSIPGLVSGEIVSDVRVRDASDLKLTLAEKRVETNWSNLPSVFKLAHELGVNSAVVGWYHPYDRLFGQYLSYCVWYPLPMFDPATATTFVGSLGRQLACVAGFFNQRRLFIDICENGLSQSLQVVTNTDFGLKFLHLAPPHKPWVYAAAQAKFTVFGSAKPKGYFPNLRLADKDLGLIRRAMEQSGLWDKTWVILTTDHSWRESPRYDGKRDLRVPFLIKAPGSNSSMVYSNRLNTVLTRDLVLAVFRGQISSQQDLPHWLDTHRITETTTHDAEQE
jgi:hypothetical protein